jgi:hypothetical protein
MKLKEDSKVYVQSQGLLQGAATLADTPHSEIKSTQSRSLFWMLSLMESLHVVDRIALCLQLPGTCISLTVS